MRTPTAAGTEHISPAPHLPGPTSGARKGREWGTTSMTRVNVFSRIRPAWVSSQLGSQFHCLLSRIFDELSWDPTSASARPARVELGATGSAVGATRSARAHGLRQAAKGTRRGRWWHLASTSPHCLAANGLRERLTPGGTHLPGGAAFARRRTLQPRRPATAQTARPGGRKDEGWSELGRQTGCGL